MTIYFQRELHSNKSFSKSQNPSFLGCSKDITGQSLPMARQVQVKLILSLEEQLSNLKG